MPDPVRSPRSEVCKAATAAMCHAGIAIDGHRVDRLDDALPSRGPPAPFEGGLEEIPQADGDGVAREDVALPVHIGKPRPRLAAGKLDTPCSPVRKDAPQTVITSYSIHYTKLYEMKSPKSFSNLL